MDRNLGLRPFRRREGRLPALRVTKASKRCPDSVGLARAFDLGEVVLQIVQLRLQPPGVRQ